MPIFTKKKVFLQKIRRSLKQREIIKTENEIIYHLT